jgi:hypothetical protein
MPFFLDGNPTSSEVSEAVNYLLSNFTQNVNADPGTGQISGPTGAVTGYIYKYISVKYADSFDGTVNFSNSPTSRLYYGLRNNDSSTESTNPADYIWTLVAGGFGTTKFLYYITTGGRQAQFAVATSTPNTGWVVDPGTAIDLDVISGTNGPANFVIIRITNDSSAPTNAECIAAIGRGPISGDLATVNYNSGISSIVYKYTTGWAVFQKYITGDLIVAATIIGANIAAGTITANKLNVTQLSAIVADLGSITAGDITVGSSPAISGTTMTGSGTHLYSNGRFVLGNSTTNISFDNTNLSINGSLIGTANVVANAITVSAGATNSGSGANITISLTAGDKVFVNGYSSTSYPTSTTTLASRTTTLAVSGAASGTLTSQAINYGLDATLTVLYCGATPVSSVYTAPSTGSYTFTVTYNQGAGSTAVQAIGLKR